MTWPRCTVHAFCEGPVHGHERCIYCYDGQRDFAGSINDCYSAIRARKAAGGLAWVPGIKIADRGEK